MFNSDLTANRPAAGIVGRIFIATDSPYGIFRDTGSAWDQIAGTGGASTNIYNSNGTLTGNRVVSSGGFNLSFTSTTYIGTAAIGGGGSGQLIVGSSSADNGIQIFGANSPSLRIDNAQSGGSQRFVIGAATATNNFIQGSTSGQFCISTASSGAVLFGMWQTINATEVMRISTASNLLIGGTVDAGFKVDITGTSRVSGVARFDNSVEFRSTTGNTKFTIQGGTGWNTTISTGSFGSAGLRFGDGAFANLLIGTTGDSIDGNAMLDLRCNRLGLYLNRGTITTMPNLTNWLGVSVSIVGGSGYTDGLYSGVAATGNYFGTVLVNVGISGGSVNAISLFSAASKIQLGETFTIPASSIGGTGSGMSFTITAINNQNPAFTFYNTSNNLLTYWDGTNYSSPIVLKLNRVLIGGTGLANASSILELSSTSQGFLPPRMTTTQINAISSPAEGLVIYNTTLSHLCCYQAGAWAKFSHSPM
jgi:hypothetical protein